MCVGLALGAAPAACAARPETNRYREFLFGVDYYPELCPESVWGRDAAMMQECGVNVVRLGEFAWSIMEPEEGRFDFSLFDRAIATLGRHGIKTIFGTPTATPPKWMTSKYPETLHVFATGQPANDQSRRYCCYNSEVYQRFSHRIVEEIVKHYASDSNIVGWQIDNELNNENPECYSASCRAAFRKWLAAKYGSLDELNRRWGTRFWSQWYTDWNQIDLPFPTPSYHNPGLILDYKRFTSDSATAFLEDQVATIRKYRPNDFTTTNGLFRNIDYYRFARSLDLHSFSNYPTFQSEPQYETGAQLTLLRGIRGRMMIMEQLTGPTGQTYLLRTPRPGEMNLWAMQTLAHGSDGVLHFNWRTTSRGVEQFWFGVLDADNVPRARYREFKKEGLEMRRVGPEVLGSEVVSDIAVIKDFEDDWVFDLQYLTSEAGTGEAYNALYRAAAERHFNIDFVGPSADLSRYKIVFAPALVLVDPDLSARLRRFVAGGGILVMSAESATKDRDNARTGETPPSGLTDLFGAEVEAFAAYTPPSREQNAARIGDAVAPVRVFAEQVKPTTATVVGTWQKDYLAGLPACTENRSGAGLAVYYGSFFNLESARALVDRYAARAGLRPLLDGVPSAVEVTRRTKGATNYYFVLNHANAPVEVAPGAGFYDVIAGAASPERFTLGPFEYRVLRR
jgi:beta-galactosidase